MHKSRLAGFIIDCNQPPLPAAAHFWSIALGMPARLPEGFYAELDDGGRDLHLEVQTVEHDSRVHLDIETDDVEAEVGRLEELGAKRVKQTRTWWVMEAPTGHRFCVVRAKTSRPPETSTPGD